MNDYPNILVVDDNIENLKVISGFLKGKGYNLALAQDGENALDILSKTKIDLILLDIMMPNMNGFEVCSRIKGQDKLSEIPIIFVTAKTETEDITKAFEIGGVDYITKPFKKDELLARIKTHLDLYLTKKHIRQLNIELIAAKEKAEDASKSKNIFLANMSHEIRTPLNAIIGILRNLIKDDPDYSKNSNLEKANAASQHLLSIINNVLDISKIEAGQFLLEKSHFNFRLLIDEVISIMALQASEKGLQLNAEIDKNIETVFIGDKARVRQILINLISNAIKFTTEGHVSLIVKLINSGNADQSISVTIEDTGIGMDKAFKTKLFKKFTQEDASTARKYGGTGLGLAISYELTKLMKGSIKIKSKKHIGTTITLKFKFPIGDKSKIEPMLNHNDFKKLFGKHILLVEDNEINRLVARQALTSYGITISEAENGKIAVKKAENTNYDAILMDVQMPEMDGIEATKQIRDKLKLSVPIIALSANALKHEIEDCLKAGMNHYVTKPFMEATLLSAILKSIDTSGIFHSEPILITNKLKKNKLFDITHLQEMSKGDTVFVSKMLNLFAEETPFAIKQITDAYAVADYKTVSAVAHRIKPGFVNLKINSLIETIRDIEFLAKEKPKSTLLKEQIQILQNEIIKVLDKIKESTSCSVI